MTSDAGTEVCVNRVSDSVWLVVAVAAAQDRIVPVASCGSQDHAEIVRSALVALPADQLRSALDDLPRISVPGTEPEVRITRAPGSRCWDVTSLGCASSGSASTSRAGAADIALDRVREFGGRAMVVFRDHNGLRARLARRQATAHPSEELRGAVSQQTTAPGLVWSKLMANIDQLTESDDNTAQQRGS